jgi:hypothetical protein
MRKTVINLVCLEATFNADLVIGAPMTHNESQ